MCWRGYGPKPKYRLNADLFKHMVPEGERMDAFAICGIHPTNLWNYYQGRCLRDPRKRQALANHLHVLVTRLWSEV